MQRVSVQYPVLGPMSRQQLREALQKSMTDEATAADFYSRLLPHSPDPLDREYIEHAREDELFHLRHFENLYDHYFGRHPNVTIAPVMFINYREALLMALDDEQHAASFYKDVQLSVRDPIVRDTFYLAMVDEMEHATMFGTLYNLRR